MSPLYVLKPIGGDVEVARVAQANLSRAQRSQGKVIAFLGGEQKAPAIFWAR
jgi:hypothetical protein